MSNQDAIDRCAQQVRGLDIHPVAVIIARVTWLLALGPAIQDRRRDLFVPVFLGDALQWNVSRVQDSAEVQVPVPDEPALVVPAGFAEDQTAFDAALRILRDGLAGGATIQQVERNLSRIAGRSKADCEALAKTYGRLLALYRSGRDHIWPYVMSNLMRPLWLSRPDQLADVLIGNPPWVAYRHLSAELKLRVREACVALDIWVGGKLATQQDLCALFWARCAQRYVRLGGVIAFVLPYAALNRPAFAGLRTGQFMRSLEVRIDAAWRFDEQVRPLFPVPACVLFGRRAAAGRLPARVIRYAGTLPRRDANEREADKFLVSTSESWPPIPTLTGNSLYRERFRQGATIVPRRFFIVTRVAAGRLGSSQAAPRVRGKTGSQDNRPWTGVEPPEGPVEQAFLRPIILGETIAPYRLLTPALGVVPLSGGTILDSEDAAREGHAHLAAWLRNIEQKWLLYCNKSASGAPRMTLSQQLDHMRKLSMQAGRTGATIVYAASGTLPAAAVVYDGKQIVEHACYWSGLRSVPEGRYLLSILNSEGVRLRVEAMQPKGQGGARHFDNLVWELRIPEFDRADTLHKKLAEAAAVAEQIAARVPLEEGAYFTTQRRAIREALAADGIARRIEGLVARLLG